MHADPTRSQAIAALNREPLNRAAAALLPDDWLDSTSFHILELALWGTENGISVEPPGARVTDDHVRYALHALRNADPGRSMEVFEGPPDGTDAMLQADDLEGVDRDQGAFRVLETIRDRLIAR